MIYKEGMLCKHFKGQDLLHKNIYKIIKLGVSGDSVDLNSITYTGDGILEEASDLVVYQNIFQNNKYFAREYYDISSELSLDQQEEFHQKIKVQPLSNEEIKLVTSEKFMVEKNIIEEEKYESKKVKK